MYYADRVKQTTDTTGTGAYSISAVALPGYATWAAAIPDGSQTGLPGVWLSRIHHITQPVVVRRRRLYPASHRVFSSPVFFDQLFFFDNRHQGWWRS